MTRRRAALACANPPILVCTDIQTRYLGDEGLGGCRAARCLALLELWRTELWPVLHLKRIAQAQWFDPASNATDWVAPFRPAPGEMVFEHPLPSAYSSSRFAEYMANMGVHCLMAGCSLDEAILATVIEGFHRGHRFLVAGDAATCVSPGSDDAEAYRAAMMRAVGKFARIEQSSGLIEAAASEM